MVKINLFKNEKLVLSKAGKLEDRDCIFENIVYNLDNYILTREDDSFKYQLDFNNEQAFVTIKDKDYVLDLKIKVISKVISDEVHKISYEIESENKISNVIEVILK